MICDRREIAGLLLKFFPSMKDASSDDWHYFLDEMTGMETPLDMPNGDAFDRWRMAMAGIGYPVWGYTKEHIEAMRANAIKLRAAEEKRAAALGTTLEELAKAAPNWPVAEVLADTERKPK
jgi:hypothetical protein